MPEPAAGSIYDLGYRRYEGVRLGRGHAVAAIYWHTLRSIFGIGRGTGTKVVAIGLAVVTLVPAAVQLAVAAIASDTISVIHAEGYYSYIQWPLAVFLAAVAPEVVGRDQKTRVLTLYFSRSLLRQDYVLAKALALVTSLLLLTLVPQAVMMLGNAFAGDSTAGYLRDNWRDTFPIVASGLLLSVFFAAVGLLVASQTPRRAYATGGILAYFAVGLTVGSVLAQAAGSVFQEFGLLVSGFHIVQGFTAWIFGSGLGVPGAKSGAEDDLARAGLAPGWYAAAALAMAAAAFALVYQRYRRMQV